MRLKELRLKAGISQAELGKQLGVTGQTVLNWESNIFEPKIEYLIKLADYFNVTIDYLVERPKKQSKAQEVCNELNKITYKELLKFIKDKLEQYHNEENKGDE